MNECITPFISRYGCLRALSHWASLPTKTKNSETAEMQSHQQKNGSRLREPHASSHGTPPH